LLFLCFHIKLLSKLNSKTNIPKAILAEISLLAAGIGLYSLFPFASLHLDITKVLVFSQNILLNFQILVVTAFIYLLIFSFGLKKKANFKNTKALNLFNFINGKKTFSQIKNDFLVLLLKFQFIPLMYLGMLTYILYLYEALTGEQPLFSSGLEYYNGFVFPVFIKAAMIVALAVYAFGYMVESDRFKTTIKSIDTTYLGWVVTLICYLPTYAFVFYIIPMAAEELAFFKSQEITAVVRTGIMIVLIFKLWAIFNLGGKSSNLTNRGIVTKGAYRIIRHPHYTSKLIIWWACAIPTLYYHWTFIGGMIFWTVIYVLRALTEEQHLRKDTDYKAYMKKVKWKFIPFVY